MRKEKKIFWILKIDKTKDIRFCKRYIGTKEISLKENKRIIDKLYKQNINEISWIAEEAINYPYFNSICEELKLLQDKVDIDMLIMINSENIFKKEMIEKELSRIKINSWILLGFMPVLLDLHINTEELKISKINSRHFYYNSIYCLVSKRISHFYQVTEYTIVRHYNIILPNGDIAIMSDKDSAIIGNILKDNADKIEKNFSNKKRALIPKQSGQKNICCE